MKDLALQFDLSLQKNIIGLLFLISEDNRSRVTTPIHHHYISDGPDFLLFLCELNTKMLNRLTGPNFLILYHIDSNMVRRHELVGDLLHPMRDSRREQQKLDFLGALLVIVVAGLNYLLDFVLESHVQHSIGLVDTEYLNLVELKLASTQKVQNSSRSSYYNVHSVL